MAHRVVSLRRTPTIADVSWMSRNQRDWPEGDSDRVGRICRRSVASARRYLL